MIQRPSGAFVYIDEIVNSLIAKASLTNHYYVRLLPLVAEGIRELSKHSVDCIHHAVIPRYQSDAGSTGKPMNLFPLPDSFTDWLSVGARDGAWWVPVSVHERLLPVLEQSNNAALPLATIEGATYADATQPTDYTQVFGSQWFYGYGWNWHLPAVRNTGVTIDKEMGAIVCAPDFPHDELYLTYTAVGSVVPGTHIPRTAQEAVETYAMWKYHLNRGEYGAAQTRLQTHQSALKRLRRSQFNVTGDDILRLLSESYGPVKSLYS